ncbi:MAG: isoleucine--tRNA ligase [Desulfovibrio sp.]|nr:isoleucine--tRNA ligase [Desulfovibrio sp.]
MNDYKHTLNLPKTKFEMRANLVRREPEMLKRWQEINAALAMTAASGAKGAWILHDGPPYANGHIHMGTAMNKILKDVIVKSRNMQGYACEYVPGWDCHGLPIEHKVEQDLKAKGKTPPVLTVRRLCREYAAKWIDIQRQEFIRLGVLGEWQRPYLSMQPEYEAATASNLAEFVARGNVVRAKKSIHWCASCHTALAEAEVEYADESSPSIYVAFPLPHAELQKAFPNADNEPAFVVIWTTTPWTVPDNVAICLHPEYAYALVQANGGQYVIAKELFEAVSQALGWQDAKIRGTIAGQVLEGLICRHPWLERESPLILGYHVTLDAGTGCVHTAPGHGREDFEIGMKYGLEIISPMDDAGRFYPSVPLVGGKTAWEANPIVLAKLEEQGALLASGKISHSYPHCWRCKEPVIFRATTQWFISMEANDLRKKALDAIANDVRWIPAWGRDRIYNMVESRPDWCISRQRAWGVPIVALKCKNCGHAWNDPVWMHEICARFATHPHGCDFWYQAPLAEIVPPGLKCPACGAADWQKETDILDVWFDSGTSFAAVLDGRQGLRFPADLYFEGSDQHRGWFHSSLLIAIGVRDKAPYRTVLTHGYVVDADGRKMSKSIGNVVAPQELIDKYGAEIVRIWAASVDYQEDIRISDEILQRLVDAYRRIRNTCRFILGNLHDFTPEKIVPIADLEPLDRFALDACALQHEERQKAYLDFEFHKVFHSLHRYCVTDLSAVYLDMLKDRLYASAADGQGRRSAQTALWHILNMLLRDMAPILSFTAEEIFGFLPAGLKGPEQTVFALQPLDCSQYLIAEDLRDDWNYLLELRSLAARLTEPMRKTKEAGTSLDTALSLYLNEEGQERLARTRAKPEEVFIVSQFRLADLADAPASAVTEESLPGAAMQIAKAAGAKCGRCWTWCEELGADSAWPDICPRCAAVMSTLEQ